MFSLTLLEEVAIVTWALAAGAAWALLVPNPRKFISRR